MSSSVFISAIPARLTEASLREHLTKFGNLVSLTVPTRKSGGCRGYAMATFESEAAAEAAIASEQKPENTKIKIERLEMTPIKQSHKPIPSHFRFDDGAMVYPRDPLPWVPLAPGPRPIWSRMLGHRPLATAQFMNAYDYFDPFVF